MNEKILIIALSFISCGLAGYSEEKPRLRERLKQRVTAVSQRFQEVRDSVRKNRLARYAKPAVAVIREDVIQESLPEEGTPSLPEKKIEAILEVENTLPPLVAEGENVALPPEFLEKPKKSLPTEVALVQVVEHPNDTLAARQELERKIAVVHRQMATTKFKIAVDIMVCALYTGIGVHAGGKTYNKYGEEALQATVIGSLITGSSLVVAGLFGYNVGRYHVRLKNDRNTLQEFLRESKSIE